MERGYAAGGYLPGVQALVAAYSREWLQVRSVRDQTHVDALGDVLDRGEAEAIVLLQEVAADPLLVDDRQARGEAVRRGIPHTGTIGVLRLARDRGLIAAAYPILQQPRRPNFWISDALLERIAREEQ